MEYMRARAREAGKPHIGAIEGLHVGRTFESFREMHASGMHRSIQCGIVGWEKDGGCESIVLNGKSDNADLGDVFIYVGEGGRSSAEISRDVQDCDMSFERGNGGLRLSFERGLPVRVIRGHKLKRSNYAPAAGYRYDGLYRVVDVQQVRGRFGFVIIQFHMSRIEGQEPAVWDLDDELAAFNTRPDVAGFIPGLKAEWKTKAEADADAAYGVGPSVPDDLDDCDAKPDLPRLKRELDPIDDPIDPSDSSAPPAKRPDAGHTQSPSQHPPPATSAPSTAPALASADPPPSASSAPAPVAASSAPTQATVTAEVSVKPVLMPPLPMPGLPYVPPRPFALSQAPLAHTATPHRPSASPLAAALAQTSYSLVNQNRPHSPSLAPQRPHSPHNPATAASSLSSALVKRPGTVQARPQSPQTSASSVAAVPRTSYHLLQYPNATAPSPHPAYAAIARDGRLVMTSAQLRPAAAPVSVQPSYPPQHRPVYLRVQTPPAQAYQPPRPVGYTVVRATTAVPPSAPHAASAPRPHFSGAVAPSPTYPYYYNPNLLRMPQPSHPPRPS